MAGKQCIWQHSSSPGLRDCSDQGVESAGAQDIHLQLHGRVCQHPELALRASLNGVAVRHDVIQSYLPCTLPSSLCELCQNQYIGAMPAVCQPLGSTLRATRGRIARFISLPHTPMNHSTCFSKTMLGTFYRQFLHGGGVASIETG